VQRFSKSLRLDSEGSLDDFISKSTETNREIFSLRNSSDWNVMNNFFDEISTSMETGRRARPVLLDINRKTAKAFSCIQDGDSVTEIFSDRRYKAVSVC
jgi:hypothetical protein